MSDALWILAGIIGGIVAWELVGGAIFLLNEWFYVRSNRDRPAGEDK